MNAISVRGLGFDYGDGWVFHNLNLDIPQGDFVAVIGNNGAGKSTLLKMLARVITPTIGEIAYYGQSIKNFSAWDKVGYVPQNPAKQQYNFPISVEEVVALGQIKSSCWWKQNKKNKEVLEECLEAFDLQNLRKRRIGELSGGQQQRVFLARAMVKKPEILLLDEPGTGIDALAKQLLYNRLKHLNREENITIVMVSHDLDLAAEVAQSALCINHGVCFRGAVREALEHHHRHR